VVAAAAAAAWKPIHPSCSRLTGLLASWLANNNGSGNNNELAESRATTEAAGAAERRLGFSLSLPC